jgi:signal transduction histidine kinase
MSFEVAGLERATMVLEATAVALAALFSWWRRPTLAVRSAVVVIGLTTVAALALPLFGPTMGTGLLFFAAILTGSFRHAHRGAVAVIIVLAASFLLTALAGPGPHAISLPPRVWVRVGVTSWVTLLACTYGFLKLRAMVLDSLAAELRAQAAQFALEQRQREMLAAATNSQRLEAVGQLAGGVAHDFNNALTIIRSGLDLLEEPGSDDERREVLEECAQGVERAMTSTRQLLSFSRARHDEQGHCVPAEVLRSFHRSLARVLPANARLDLELDGDTRTIGLPSGAFEQALLNLTLNARDALPPGGGLIRLRCTGAGPMLEVAVQDTGRGMSDEVKAQAFTPFFTTKGEQGTGLGLAMVQATVARVGGSIALESTLGVGTTFTLRLPAVEPPGPAKPVVASTGVGSGTPVLVVDDERPLRLMLRLLLEREGYRVFEADTVAQVGAVLRSVPVALVIADGVLSDGAFADVRACCATLRPGARLLRCSGEPSLVDDANTLCRPFEPGALVAKVAELLSAEGRPSQLH